MPHADNLQHRVTDPLLVGAQAGPPAIPGLPQGFPVVRYADDLAVATSSEAEA